MTKHPLRRYARNGRSLFVIAFAMIVVMASSVGRAQAAQLSCKHLHIIEQGFLHQHITFNKFSNTLESRTVDQYIKKLDGAKIYFLKSDIDDIKKKMSGVFAKLQNADCTAIDEIQKLYVA